MSKHTPTVRWQQKANIKKRKPKPVAVIRFACPDCKKQFALTLDKKTCKRILTEIKSGGNPIPRGALVAPIQRRKSK